jgi:hypothetical protein
VNVLSVAFAPAPVVITSDESLIDLTTPVVVLLATVDFAALDFIAGAGLVAGVVWADAAIGNANMAARATAFVIVRMFELASCDIMAHRAKADMKSPLNLLNVDDEG